MNASAASSLASSLGLLAHRSRPRIRRGVRGGEEGLLPSLSAHQGHAHARGRRRPPLHPGDAWPRRPQDDAGLHPRLHREAPGRPRRHASGGQPGEAAGGPLEAPHEPDHHLLVAALAAEAAEDEEG